MTITAEQAQAVLHDAELLYSQEHIAATLDNLAQAISAKLAQSDPFDAGGHERRANASQRVVHADGVSLPYQLHSRNALSR